MSKVPYTPGDRPNLQETVRAIFRLIGVAWHADRVSFSILWSMVFIGGPLTGLTVYATAKIVDALTALHATDVWMWIGLLVSSMLVRGVFVTVVYNNRVDRMQQMLTLELEKRYLGHIIKLPYDVLEDPKFEALTTVIAEKRGQVPSVFIGLTDYIAVCADIIGLATAVIFIPWQVTVVLVLSLLVRYLANRSQTHITWNILKISTREGRRAMYYRRIIEAPRLLEKVKGIGLAESFYKHWEKLAAFLVQKRKEARFKNSLWGIIIFLVDSLGMGMGVILLGQGILAGSSALSGFVVFITSYQRLTGKIAELSKIISHYMIDAPIVALLFRIFDIEGEKETGKPLPKQALIIRFDEVSFRYPDTEHDVLKNVSFEFQEGDHLALVGLNGAGKSTILKLLMGMYQPTSGKITINGISVSDVKPSALRRALAVMNQEPPRYSDVISEQVYYGDYASRREDDRFLDAVNTSGLEEVIKDLPSGLETMVGKSFAMPEDRAIELSGGQNQILDIARTLYRQARIYVFDEPTSAVDAEKEESFFSRLPKALAGKAIIFVSHRFSTLRRAKRILVIEAGRLIEDGSHEELIQKKGRYAELFALQAKNYQ